MNKKATSGSIQASPKYFAFYILPQETKHEKTDISDWRLDHVNNDIIWVGVSSPNTKRNTLAGSGVLSKLSQSLQEDLLCLIDHLLVKFQVLFFGFQCGTECFFQRVVFVCLDGQPTPENEQILSIEPDNFYVRLRPNMILTAKNSQYKRRKLSPHLRKYKTNLEYRMASKFGHKNTVIIKKANG